MESPGKAVMVETKAQRRVLQHVCCGLEGATGSNIDTFALSPATSLVKSYIGYILVIIFNLPLFLSVGFVFVLNIVIIPSIIIIKIISDIKSFFKVTPFSYDNILHL